MILPLLMMDIPRGAQSNDLRGIAKAKANSVRLLNKLIPAHAGVDNRITEKGSFSDG